MKKLIIFAIIALMAPISAMNGQTYAHLWKQVEKAVEDDLPQTEQQLLRQIAQKAELEKEYGQLLKAELQEARALTEVSRDSLKPAVERLVKREQETKDEALRAVYNTVIGYIFKTCPTLDETEDHQLYKTFYDKAIAHPDVLARTKATSYSPVILTGNDSRLFGDDLLSVIGYETDNYVIMRDYYIKAGNRKAALLTSLEVLKQERPAGHEKLNKSVYLQRLDSLINEYADLQEAGEVAIERYHYMDNHPSASREQLWQYINLALDRWGGWQRMNDLRNCQRDLTALQFSASMEHEVNIPNRAQKVTLDNLRGITQLTMRVYSVKVDGDTELNPNLENDYKKLKPLMTALPELTQTRNFFGKKQYEIFWDSMRLEGLPVGVYMIEFESSPTTQTSRSLHFVSNVRVLSESLPNNQVRIVTLNATTGQPVKGAKVRMVSGWGKSKTTKTITTNSEGEYIHSYDKDAPREFFVTTDNDKACPETSRYGYFTNNQAQERVDHVAIYTDRQIYRPGQKVQFAAIYYETRNGREHQVQAGRNTYIKVKNANYETIFEKDLVTDEYGTCSGEFTLPTQGLNGRYTINMGSESRTIRVEEYKRPTFEVEFPEVNQPYEDGDTVVVKAKARSYAGVPVQGAHVKYKVVRKMPFWWFSYSRYWDSGYIGSGSDDTEVYAGEADTDTEGCFTVEIPMILPKTNRPVFYNFVVTADVTDQAGETHQGVLSLPLGNRKTAFSTTIPEKVLAEKAPKVMFNLRNASGIDIPSTVRYRIDNGKWTEAKTNTDLDIIDSKLKSGQHTLEAICEQDSLTKKFVLFSLNDKQPATETDDWFYVTDTQFPNDGRPVTIQVGSSAKDVHILYTVIAGDQVLECGSVERSNQLINRQLTYKEEYGNGLLLNFAWVKEGKTYTHQTTITRPMPDKQLRLQWQTFRDRLTPGQEEEWTLTIMNPPAPGKTGNGGPAKAQLMATLYDKSLDQLVSNYWSLSPYVWLPIANTDWLYETWGGLHFSGHKRQSSLYSGTLSFNHFDHNIYPSEYGRYRPLLLRSAVKERRANGSAMLKEVMAEESMAAADVEEADQMVQKAPLAMDMVSTYDEAAEEGTQQVEMRENLNETAFFYPQLATDEQGGVSIKFTLPESLTTWRFIGLAHTTDMMHGMLEGETVAKKDVMIQPNMPRFVRLGDKATISARIFNTGEKAVSGTARLQLIDPETEKVVYDQKQQVSLAVDSTASVLFHFNADDIEQSLLIAKMSVSGKDFSDGEQHYLPILPNSERVTVTVPFSQLAPGTKTIDLGALFPENQLSPNTSKLTVEYTNNPAWLMIQALPTVGTPCDENAISQAASYYANAIGRHIIAQNPNAKGIFEMWKREEGNETSLMSNLQKNQELKDLVLGETPWVMDADREQEQKQRLSDFFDEPTMKQRLSSAINQLKKLQLGNGAWTWWKGMNGSMYITVEISEMLVRLNQMTGEQNETKDMLKSAFKYMGNEIVDMVKEMKKQEKKGIKQYFPSHKALQWLYICAIDGRKLPSDVVEANNYLKNLLKKDTKNQTIYEKAMSAIVLESKTYIKSLKEFTVYKEEMGRYYDTHRAGYSWRDYRIPTQVAAIEAIKRMTPEDTVTIDEMQRWLLQQKRTQAWDTPINSVNAVYAFLNGESRKLMPQEKTVLRVDGQEIETSNATAGIGYVKTAMSGKGTKTFTAEKTSTGTSWGAVYAQFMQHTSDIADHQSGITVKREILSSNLKSQTSNLKTGDRVTVRITIEAERNYDFVQVVDKRAACMEPINQLSGYHRGMYCSPKDYTTNYYFDMLSKGKHVIENEYYIDRAGTYETGTCTVECAYSPEYRATTKSITINVE